VTFIQQRRPRPPLLMHANLADEVVSVYVYMCSQLSHKLQQLTGQLCFHASFYWNTFKAASL